MRVCRCMCVLFVCAALTYFSLFPLTSCESPAAGGNTLQLYLYFYVKTRFNVHREQRQESGTMFCFSCKFLCTYLICFAAQWLSAVIGLLYNLAYLSMS